MNRQNRLATSLMVLVILLSFLLRVHRLGAGASFTTDEVTTVTNSMRRLAEIPKLESKTPLQALWIRFGAMGLGLGYGEFTVYFLSVIAGVLAVAIVYRLGRSLFDYRVGLLCAFMLAFSAYHIYWSRSARYYSLMVLLSSASFLFLYKALVTNSRKAWLGYALFRTLSLYDHLTAVWMLAGEVVFALAYLSFPALRRIWQHRHKARDLDSLVRLWRVGKTQLRRRDIQHWLASSRFLWLAISMALILLAYAPRWYSLVSDVYLGSAALRLGSVSTGQLAPSDPRSGQLRPVLGGGWLGPFLVLYLLDAWNTPLHVVMMVAFGAGLLFCALRRQWTQLLFTLTIVATPFVLTATAKTYGVVLNGRYLISLLPLYYMMAGRGISGFGHRIVRVVRLPGNLRVFASQAVLVVSLLVYAGLSFTRIPLTYRNTGPNWRAVGQFLAQNARPDQTIVVHGAPVFPKALQYYLPQHTVIENDPRLSYDTLYREEDSFWLVFLPGTDMYTGLRDWVDRSGAVSLIFTGAWYPDIDRNTALAPAQNWDLYVAYISRAITSTEEALAWHHAWLAQAEARNPDDVRRHLTLAEAYRRFDRPAQAVVEYTKALAEGNVNDQLASYIYDARGMSWHRLGKREQAIADWQQAIVGAGWSREAYEHLGNAYMQLGETDAAQALYQAAIAANPRKSWPHVLLGDFHRQGGMNELAIAEYSLAVAIEPGDRTAYQRLGEMYAAAGEYARVSLLYHDAMQHNPWQGWPHFQLGQFYQSVGQMAGAVVEYQRAVELQPDYGAGASRFLRDARWDLAIVLNLIHAYSDQGELLWWPGNSWVKPYPHDQEVVVGRSTLAVDGRVQPNQLFLHPFGDEDNTYIEFAIPDNPFAYLHVGYGLADDVAGQSNGVDYRIEVKRQGADEYEPLLDQGVTQTVWRERTVSLASYWGDDLEFRLAVSARGNYAYDWLQTTVELAPPAQPVWDLSANLVGAEFLTGALPLEWRGDGFYTAGGGRLVGPSDLPVGGQSLPGQVILHPYSSETDSTLVFALPHQPYRAMKTSFGLADEAAPFSNGVDYAMSVSVDGGLSFIELVHTTVTTNTWRSELVDLPSSQDLVLKLSASARQDATFDWLQVNLVLLPFDGDEMTARSMVEDGTME